MHSRTRPVDRLPTHWRPHLFDTPVIVKPSHEGNFSPVLTKGTNPSSVRESPWFQQTLGTRVNSQATQKRVVSTHGDRKKRPGGGGLQLIYGFVKQVAARPSFLEHARFRVRMVNPGRGPGTRPGSGASGSATRTGGRWQPGRREGRRAAPSLLFEVNQRGSPTASS